MNANLLFDTGATTTAIRPALAERLGLSPDPDESVTEMTSMTEVIESQLYRLPALHALGCSVEDLTIAAVEIPPEAGVSGVLGYDFLKQFRILLNPRRGVLVVQPAERLNFANRIEVMRHL